MTEPIKVLIVDDDPSFRFLTKKSLMNYDSSLVFKIHEAVNGREGLFLFSSSPGGYNLILLDINMPEMNGIEFLEAYKQLHPSRESEPHIYILSTDPSCLLPETRKSINGCFEKPLTAEHISIILMAMGLKK